MDEFQDSIASHHAGTNFQKLFAQGIHQADGLELVAFHPENKFVDFVTFFDGNEEVTLPIKLDGLFVVTDLITGETLALFPEAERLTSPNKRSTFKQSRLYKKVLAFPALLSALGSALRAAGHAG